MSERYSFTLTQQKMLRFWQEKQIYKWDASSTQDNFVIDTPPPTISGDLHMGHVFSYCHTDFVARFMRMTGKKVFYPMGFDCNGLPTERLVEKEHNIVPTPYTKDTFIQLCRDVTEDSKKKFSNLFNLLGLSIDWSLEYSTLDIRCQVLSQSSFMDLFDKKDIYYATKPVMWDVETQTAVAQSEIETKNVDSYLYFVNFDLVGLPDFEKSTKQDCITIATTRPELLAACVALLYHPQDARYQHLRGRKAVVPIFNIQVPILTDENVKPEKGTGLVMCATFGDFLDVKWQQQYDLPMRVILDSKGRITADNILDLMKDFSHEQEKIFKVLIGLSVKNARSKMLSLLGNLVVEKKKYQQNVRCFERSGKPIEILSNGQWFIKSMSYKDQMLKLSSQVNWYPDHMKIKLDRWIENLEHDWCISRQRYLGIPIPVWFSKKKGEEGKIILPKFEDLPVDPKKDLPHGYSADEVIPENSILDTWATSCITPCINAYGINNNFVLDKNKYEALLPSDLRVQGHEIIRTWTFGTLLKSFLHNNQLPWKNIMLSGWCLAEDKTKMSKSKGNICSAHDFLNTYGADVMRYWCSSAGVGADIVFSEKLMQDGKKLMTKIYNGGKFCLLHTKDLDISQFLENEKTLILKKDCVESSLDKWIITELDLVLDSSFNFFKNYDYHNARLVIEEFFKKTFCDTYIELVKTRIYGTSDTSTSAKITVYFVFCSILKLFAPFFPYITDELFSWFVKDNSSIHSMGMWPMQSTLLHPAQKERITFSMTKIIAGMKSVFNIKSQLNIGLKYPIEKLFLLASEFEDVPQDLLQDFQNASVTKEITFIQSDAIDSILKQDGSVIMSSNHDIMVLAKILVDK